MSDDQQRTTEEARERNLLVTARETERELKALAAYDIEPDEAGRKS